MKNEKITRIRVHQTIKFNKKETSYFNHIPTKGGETPAAMKIIPELQCVLIEGGEDRILVPFTNIANMKLASKEEIPKQLKKSKN